MPASGKLRSRCTRHTTLRGPKRPPSAGRSGTERAKARPRGSITFTPVWRWWFISGGRLCLYLGLQHLDPVPVRGVQSSACVGKGRVQLEGPAVALLCTGSLTTKVPNRALLTQERGIHSNAVRLVLAEEFDGAGRVEALEDWRGGLKPPL